MHTAIRNEVSVYFIEFRMALQQLTAALESLSKSVSNFNVGAVSLDDFKPFEEQLTDVRHILKVQKAHSMIIQAKNNSKSVAENHQEDVSSLVSRLHDDIANLQIANAAITLCLHSCSSNDIFFKEKPTPEFKKQVQSGMRKLFTLNDSLISLHTSLIEASKHEMRLKIEDVKLLREYREFLKEQEKVRDKKLEETNPQILKNKKKLEVKIAKINIMKRLMTSMIATSGNIVMEKPFLFQMLKKHRELINIESIIEMGRNKASQDTSPA